MEHMGEKIAELRRACGMTQAELGEKMGLTDKAVSKWERGLSCPDIASVPRLAEILGVTVEELMKGGPGIKENKFREIFMLALRAVALAMGIASAVLLSLDELELKSALIMLSLGLTALALYLLEEKSPGR